jgi:hypothetical protein
MLSFGECMRARIAVRGSLVSGREEVEGVWEDAWDELSEGRTRIGVERVPG